tara:strand:- start:48 stop:986 length:939 start_codon:yes stop_codon:yes gene_type:complete
MSKSNFLQVESNDIGVRLDKFIFKKFSNISYSIIQKNIRMGLFKVNGSRKKSNYKLSYLDKIYYSENLLLAVAKEKKIFINKDVKINLRKAIVFEDNDIIILNKPYGMPVQGGSKINFSVDDALSFLCTEKQTLKLTHRIDKNTTGILIIAKSKEIAKKITELFRENKIKKTYWALVKGKPKNKTGCIKEAIYKTKVNNIEKMKVLQNKEKNSITFFKTIESKNGLSLLEVYPKTGRTHQIRVHLLSENCPILGDKKYNIFNKEENKSKENNYKMHLHAKSISFELKKKKYTFEAKLPLHFYDTLKLNNFSI